MFYFLDHGGQIDSGLIVADNSANVSYYGFVECNLQCNNITALVSVESMTCSGNTFISGRPYSNRYLIKGHKALFPGGQVTSR